MALPRVKEAFHIRGQYPVHLLARQGNTQCIECLVLAPSGPEAVTETDEVLFVDALHHPGDRLLDDLVFQSRDVGGILHLFQLALGLYEKKLAGWDAI